MSWQPLKLSDKTQKTLKTIVTWTVVFIAYAYLGYTLWTMDWTAFQAGHVSPIRLAIYLAITISLMPLNIGLEALKWQYLLRDTYPMRFREAQRQVYYGFIGGFITPYRAGDYPARVLIMHDSSCWKKAIALGVYGSVVLTAIILLAGLFPFWAYVSNIEARWWMCLPVLIPLVIPKFRTISALSLARYLVFSTQLYMMLRLVGLDISAVEAISRIPYYYLLVTITPNIPISDPAIRGSWAVIAFGPTGAVASLGLWMINTLLPVIIGSFCKKR